MRTRICGLAAVALFLQGTGAHAARLADEPAPRFEDAAMDGQGVLWAVTYGDVCIYDGKAWYDTPQVVKPDAQRKPRPMRLTRMQDGSMSCVWQVSGSSIAVTTHSSTGAQVLGQCDGRIDNVGLLSPPFADSQDRLWVVNAKPEIYRADANGLALVYTIKPEQLISAGDLKAHYATVYACEDGRNRVWAWTNSLAGGMNGAALRGVLIFDGTNVTQQEKFTGIKGDRFSFIDRKDAGQMWLGVARDGLYTLNIDTFAAERVADPEPGAFYWTKKAFSTGGDVFVIASKDSDLFHDALWRRHEGEWTRLTENVDGHFSSTFEDTRPWLRCGRDLLMCAYSGPVWDIRPAGKPRLLNWQNGFPVDDPRLLYQLRDGSLAGLNSHGRPFDLKVTLPPPAPRPSRATELRIQRGWTTGADGSPWTILSDTSGHLSHWTGTRWAAYPLPAGFKPDQHQLMRMDSAGRLWFMAGYAAATTVFFDSRTHKWNTWAEPEKAFEAVRDEPPVFSGDYPIAYTPAYSADGRRIAYRRSMDELAYCDGTTWRRFTYADIPVRKGVSNFTLPYFDHEDRLCLNPGHETLTLDVTGHWVLRAFEENPGAPRPLQPRRDEAPEGCVTKSPDSMVTDNRGVAWLTWRGTLYKCAMGECLPVLSKDEANPFPDRRELHSAWVDGRGNAFIEVDSNRRIMIAPKSPPPTASVTVTKRADDAVLARFKSGSDSHVQYRWQLDGTGWQFAKGNRVSFETMVSGTHTLAVMAVDDELQAGPEKDVAIVITIDPQAQVAGLIRKLGDPDFSKREEVIDALSRQPANALPALRAARGSANDDVRWWIDAAIQQIERAEVTQEQHANPGTGGK